MEHTTNIHHAHANEHHSGSGEVKRITIYLTILTIIELVIGFWRIGMDKNFLYHFLTGAIVIFMLWKAFYIVAYFMHLKHELRNLISTIVAPLALFIWFIIAFLYDGDSYKNYNMNHDAFKKERSTQKVEQKAHGHSTEAAGEEKPAAPAH